MGEGHDDAAEEQWRLFPDDVLAEVLRRAAPRGLAVSRCVCKAWRALVDGRRLLRADLLPRSLAGLLIEYRDQPYFFARPSVAAGDYHMHCDAFADHCNGLLLYYDGVLNPATGGWTPLPEEEAPSMAGMEHFPHEMYLAFDPALSSHYEVFVVPEVPVFYAGPRRPSPSSTSPCSSSSSELCLSSEWPPSPLTLSVFSSRTGRRWDQRSFVREGDPAGTVADMTLDERFMAQRNAVCWRGALYVHCQTEFVLRISLSDDDNKYRVIKPPTDLTVSYCAEGYLGKSQKGVCLAVVQYHRLRVWILDDDESGGGQAKWILKHNSGDGLSMPSPINSSQAAASGPWVLVDDDSDEPDKELQWNSDDDDDGESIICTTTDEDKDGERRYVNIGILGFHPYKEIVFLHRAWRRGLAYHMNSSKLEDLGNLRPKDDASHADIRESYILEYARSRIGRTFPYTPCLMGEFSGKLEDVLDDD
ncbi:hypothetical protein EJB05_09952, partial [Eragrostis curvula]